MDKKEKNLLFKYLDGELSKDEEFEFNKLVESSKSFRIEKQEFEQMREFISSNAEKSLKPMFETRVLNELNSNAGNYQKNNFSELLAVSFRKILAPALIIILFLLSFNLISSGEVSVNSALGIQNQNVSIEEAFNSTIDLAME